MANEYGIPEVRCRTVKGFLGKLDSLNQWPQSGPWLFRGQNNETWRLRPKAMRPEFTKEYVDPILDNLIIGSSSDTFLKRFPTVDPDDARERMVFVYQQKVVERHLVTAFAKLADFVGLSVPGDHHFELSGEFRTVWDRIQPPGHDVFDVIDALEPKSIVYALSQHHGVPTRLLDWTYDPLTAAFFSAYESGPPKGTPSNIVVWMFSQRALDHTELELVTQQRSKIGFLQAQDGAFLYDRKADLNYLESGRWRTFEEQFTRLVKLKSVFKITLPYSKRAGLLDMLLRRRKSEAFLKPTFDIVAKEILRDKAYWLNVIRG